ncbi:DHA2 family efflux MFS transporter permease subunit [Scleromatobacter humisilvae]|uniref:DHA2 family efflux MFS transporter permease subunit n=1 Tax=Scleromatobacter humisilvae TaxID=2897159 RepID=A0A9X1YKD5_9BURK|nr:DHA2 family efflux MFS transporter permease subunit [Scleromatobacter humisilvae]MCK9687030.1 DHA2 family efflux MFS transporter permease subunit [Scleromatobacter humisilvae]
MSSTPIDYEPLRGRQLALAAVVLSLANFMVVLDTTITNVALPTISGNLGVSTTEGTWVITAYAVAEAITVPLTDWLSRQFGRVRLFMMSLVAFVVFSICCGLSRSLGALVLFRVLQGIAGGPLIPLSSTLMLAVFPKNKSNIALALWGMMTVVAPIFGPILGGLISDDWSWPWVFYINIGFGIFVWLGARRVMTAHESPVQRSRIDGVGLGLLVCFVTAFQIMIDKGRELDWFDSPVIVGCAIVSAISLTLFIIWELTDAAPAIDLSVFKSRTWLASTLSLSLMFGIFFGNIVLTPLWLQQQMGYTATWAGYATAPMGILAVLSSPVIGRLLPRIDARRMVTFGMLVLAGSFFMRAHLTTDSGYANVAIPMFVLGAGIPACIICLTSLGVSDLPPNKVASGAGLQNFIRIMSMAVGASLTQTYWEHMSQYDRAELAAVMDPTRVRTAIAALGDSLHGAADPAAVLSRMVDQQAVMLATNDFYALATILMLGCIAVVWFIKRPKGPLKTVAH